MVCLEQVFGCLHTGESFAESGSDGKLLWQGNEQAWWIASVIGLLMTGVWLDLMFAQHRQWRGFCFASAVSTALLLCWSMTRIVVVRPGELLHI